MYICKMYILADINKKFVHFYLKDFIFYKYICKLYKLYIRVSKKCDIQTDRHTDKTIHRGAPLLKTTTDFL